MNNLYYEVHLDRSATIFRIEEEKDFTFGEKWVYIAHCVTEEVAQDIISYYKEAPCKALKEDRRLNSWVRV